MKIFDQIKKACLLLAVFAVSLTACNKLELDPIPATPPTQGTTPTLATLLDDPSFSLLKTIVTRAGLLPTLSAPNLRFTVFAPDDAAITASIAAIAPGVPPDLFLASLDNATIKAIVQYHIIPQEIGFSSITSGFPNSQYPSIYNPAAANPAAALFRLTTFPGKQAGIGAWVNNIPIIATDIKAVNGIMHKVARIVMPPSRYLWDTAAPTALSPNISIYGDTSLSYLKATIIRADSGVVAGKRLLDALQNIGANLTIFAPTNNSMRVFLTGALAQAFIAKGFPPADAMAAAAGLVAAFGSQLISDPASIPDVIPGIVGLGPQIAAVITPTKAKGIVVYHIISSQSGTYAPPGIRVFSVNLPTSAQNVKTLLNSGGVPYDQHPGVAVQATFVSPFPGVSVVASATVKGIANATASNIVSMDIHCVNGVMHKIDQVLLPQ